MARGKTLTKLLDDYRAEARLSSNPAHNSQVRDTQINLLQRTQELLWEDFTWPHLRIERQYPCSAGQRTYDFGAAFDLDRIENIYFKTGGEWVRLRNGIDQEHYALYDSDLDARSYPVTRWKIAESEQVEVWPISDQEPDADTLEGYFKVVGIAKLPRLTADSDRAVLDDRLIVMFAAAETLGAAGAKDAGIKMKMAEKRFAKLRGNLMPRRSFRMFGGNTEPRRNVITNYRAPGS